jgi:hypothetical protein
MRTVITLIAVWIATPGSQAATVAIGINGFSPSTTVIDFVGPSANPYTEAGTVFSSGMQNISGSTLNVTDFLNPVLSVSFPVAATRVGLTNRGALPLTITLQLFQTASLTNPLDSFGPVTVGPFDFNQPLVLSFLGVQSDAPFQSLRITATNSFSLADFRFDAVPEPQSTAFLLITIPVFAGALFAKRRL